MNVNVPDDRRIHIRDRPVVEEVVVVPVSAIVTPAHIAMPVIDAAVIADVRSPIAMVPAEAAIHPSPITGSPQRADVRRNDPRARYPKESRRLVSPVTGSPQVVRAWAYGLCIHR